MAITANLYGNAILNAFSKKIDWANDTIKVALLTSSYTPNQDTHDFFDDVSSFQAVGTGYTAGGATIGSKTISYDGATNTLKLDSTADVVWATSSITARYAVIYADTGTPATSPLIGYIDFGENKISENGDFTIVWHVDGIVSAIVT